MRHWLVGILLFVPALAFAAEEASFKLKPGPGQERVANSCGICHSLDYIPMNSPFMDRKGWEASVTKMVKVMGAPLKEEEIPAIVDYLSAQYGASAPSAR